MDPNISSKNTIPILHISVPELNLFPVITSGASYMLRLSYDLAEIGVYSFPSSTIGISGKMSFKSIVSDFSDRIATQKGLMQV